MDYWCVLYIFLMHSCVESVIRQWILPDLLRRGQYLQYFLLQKENPLSLLEVPSRGVFVGVVAGWISKGFFGFPLCLRRVVTLWKKSVMDFSMVLLGLAGVSGSASGAGIYRWLGSASVSPGLGVTFARTRRSLRFLGLL